MCYINIKHPCYITINSHIYCYNFIHKEPYFNICNSFLMNFTQEITRVYKFNLFANWFSNH